MNARRESTVAVVLAAGRGSRLSAKGNKAFVRLGGEPIIVHAVRAFSSHPRTDSVVVVTAGPETGACQRVLADAGVAVDVVLPGGPTRRASEWAAVRHLAPRIERGEVDTVVIHDAARALYRGERLDELLERARAIGAAILAVPVDFEEGVRRSDERGVLGPAERTLWRAQTPQAFRASVLLEAFRSAPDDLAASDTASSVERLGHPVAVVSGTDRNLKITYPQDLVLAELLLERRSGEGDPAARSPEAGR